MAAYYAPYASTPYYNSVSNASFKATLKLFNNRILENIGAAHSLFANNADLDLHFTEFGFKPYERDLTLFGKEETDPLDWRRYFKLQLGPTAFGHKQYPLVVEHHARQAGSSPMVLPPYTPTVETLSVSYSSTGIVGLPQVFSEEVRPLPEDSILRLDFYGEADMARAFVQTDLGIRYPLLPRFTEVGHLYVGIAGFQPPGDLSVFFQMVDGSGDLDIEEPPVTWSYLSYDRWFPFPDGGVISDTTNGLMDPGIIR